MMDDSNSVQTNYDEQAKSYSQFVTTPLGTLEKDLFELCIKDCDGLKVLDLGGGTGLRARDALRAGAASVDVIDISPEMMRHGQEYEKSIGRDRITWHQADVSKPLDHLNLGGDSGQPPYDMVIANGIFEHAHSIDEYDAMWRSAAAYLKPGGRLVSNRNVPWSEAARAGKYGVIFDNYDGDLFRGISFRYRALTDPPLVFQSTALEAHYSGSFEIPGQYFEDFRTVPFEETPVVQAHRGFWREYLESPILYIFTARKKA
ncbi:ubiquinone menaquinone biosynthesis C-methyltransferase [Apiospora sp. TS-2023a]